MRWHFARIPLPSEVLPDLTAEDLKELGVAAVGHRRRLLAAIAALRDDTISLQSARILRRSTCINIRR